MVRALFDTNIIVDYLKGIAAAGQEFGRYENVAISIVTRIEVLVGVTPDIAREIRAFLDDLITVPLNAEVAERAIILRRTGRLKLADAIIWASAQAQDRLFVTRDMRDFPENEPGIRVPYKL